MCTLVGVSSVSLDQPPQIRDYDLVRWEARPVDGIPQASMQRT